MRLGMGFQVIQHDAGLDGNRLGFLVGTVDRLAPGVEADLAGNRGEQLLFQRIDVDACRLWGDKSGVNL